MSRKASRPSPTIIFDLDGTLADTWPVALKMANELNLIGRKIRQSEFERLRNIPIKDVLKELNIPIWRVPRLLVKGRAELAGKIAEIPLFPGMHEALKNLEKEGCTIYLMSSNSLDNVQQFLANNKIEKYFTDVQGGVSVFGKAKMLKKVLKEHGIKSEHAYYVGDEVRDIEAAKKAAVRSIAVTWGLNGKKFLQQFEPDHIVDTPRELVRIFKSNA